MSGQENSPDDRWQQLIRAFDPERNIRAFTEIMEEAVSASEQVVKSVTPDRPAAGEGGASFRDALVDLERSFTSVYLAASRFIIERPLQGKDAGAATGPQAEIAVLDGVGTTVLAIPGAGGLPHCRGLRRHDGAELPADAVTILQSKSFDEDGPVFVIRVDVPAATGPGVYHGQILVEGMPDLAAHLRVLVVDASQ